MKEIKIETVKFSARTLQTNCYDIIYVKLTPDFYKEQFFWLILFQKAHVIFNNILACVHSKNMSKRKTLAI